MKKTAVFAALAASAALPMAANADQYWVGGTSGLWGLYKPLRQVNGETSAV